LQYQFVKARSLSGLGDVNIRLEVSWREPPVLPVGSIDVRVPRDVQVAPGRSRLIRLPVLAGPERIAEKVRAFLERGLDRDAFDLHYHARRLTTGSRRQLRDLIQRKLDKSELPEGCDLHEQFVTALGSARRTWPRGLVIVADPPEWTDVEHTLTATTGRF
jgi:hypothetical protein